MAVLGRKSVLFLSALFVVAAAATLALGSVPTLQRPLHRDTSGSARDRVLQAYGHLPLSFQPNEGQSDPQTRFLALGGSYSLSLTAKDAVLALDRPTVRRGLATDRLALPAGTASVETLIRMSFLGAGANPHIAGVGELAGKTNYLIGNDPAAWQTNVPNYSAVAYQDLYPGVSLQFSGGGGRLEYTFLVAPGADPRLIRLGFTGQRGLGFDAAGNLILSLDGGQVVEDRPFIYQATSHGRQEVAGRYVMLGRAVGFSMGSYDRTRTLFIDPTLSYSTYLGANRDDAAFGVQVDASGNAYVTGSTGSMNFPHTSGSYRGGIDAFVTKLNTTGSGLVYSTFIGGSKLDEGRSIAVDPTGRAYITGFTSSTNFPTTTGAFDRTSNGGAYDAFLTKLNPTGTGLNYSTYLGGRGSDLGIGVTLDSTGTYPFLTGQTDSKHYPVSASAFQKTNHGGNDAFVTKVNPNPGQPLLYSTYVGGSGDDAGVAMALGDSAGRVFISGTTSSTNFPTTTGAFDRTFNGGVADAILTKVNPTGSALNYSTYLGSRAEDDGAGVAVDASGNAYISGKTASSAFPTTPGAYDRTYNGGSFDTFVTKINPNPNQPLVYSTFIGGSGTDYAGRMQVDPSGDAHVDGSTDSTNYPTVGSAFQPAYGGGPLDGFVTEVNPTGGGLVYSSFLGGSDTDAATGIALDALVKEYVVGLTASLDFPTAGAPFQLHLRGGTDAFVTKIAP